MESSEYKRFKYGDWYYEYSKEELSPELWYEDNNLPQTLIELLEKRANFIKYMISNILSLLDCENEYLKFQLENNKRAIIEVENEIYNSYFQQIKDIKSFHKTNMFHVEDVPEYEEQNGYICDRCGQIASYEQRKIIYDKLQKALTEQGADVAMDEYAGLCPNCSTKRSLNYANIYAVKANMLVEEAELALNEDDFNTVITKNFDAIEMYKKIDLFYKDLYDESLGSIGSCYMTIIETCNTCKVYDNQQDFCNSMLFYLKSADEVNTLYEPHELARAYTLYLIALTSDPHAVPDSFDKLIEIEEQINHYSEFSKYIYEKNFSDHLEAEARYCDTQILLAHIAVCNVCNMCNYRGNQVAEHRTNTRNMIISSPLFSREDKENFIRIIS